MKEITGEGASQGADYMLPNLKGLANSGNDPSAVALRAHREWIESEAIRPNVLFSFELQPLDRL